VFEATSLQLLPQLLLPLLSPPPSPSPEPARALWGMSSPSQLTARQSSTAAPATSHRNPAHAGAQRSELCVTDTANVRGR
jgi:hypothetical protein